MFTKSLAFVVIVSLFLTSCLKDPGGIPPSLENILQHNEITVDVAGGGGNTGSGGGGSSYNGVFATEVRSLLSKVSGWTATVPPQCSVGQCGSLVCMRDTYVCAAVAYAWAAEQFSLRGNPGDSQKAADAATQMHQSLLYAKNLCGNTQNFTNCGNVCKTFSIFPC